MAVRRRQIRTLVEHLLDEYSVRSVPVDVDGIARALNARVHNDAAAAESLSGFLVRDVERGYALIGVNSAHSDNRKRFTIAHELGHLLLHEGDQLHVDRREGIDLGLRMKFRDVESSLGVDDEEKEANFFAAELLMPVSLLTRDLSALRLEEPFDEDEDIIERLAQMYGVSVQAMTFRLTNLNLIHL